MIEVAVLGRVGIDLYPTEDELRMPLRELRTFRFRELESITEQFLRFRSHEITRRLTPLGSPLN